MRARVADPGSSTGMDPRPQATREAYVLVSCNRDGEPVILLPLISEARDFGIHGEPILCFSIKLLSGKKKIHVTGVSHRKPLKATLSVDSKFHAFRKGPRSP